MRAVAPETTTGFFQIGQQDVAQRGEARWLIEIMRRKFRDGD